MEQPTLRVALAQLEPEDEALATNVAHAVSAIQAHRDCDLILFPELFLSGVSADGYEDLEVAADGPEVAEIGAAGAEAGIGVVIGAALSRPQGTANAALAFGPDGALTGIYEKTHRWDAEPIVPGPTIGATEIGELRAGLMVCFDLEFPEVARALALTEPDLLVTIAANMEPFGRDHALMARTRAVENRLPHLYVNRTGSAAGNEYVGGSLAVAPSGRLIAEAGSKPTVVEVEVEIGAEGDSRVAYLDQRRPDLYRSLVDPA